MGIDLVGLQRGACDLRRLGDDADIGVRIPALGLDGAQQHAVRRRCKRHRDGLALEIVERTRGRVLGHHDAVAAALGAARQHRDEQAAATRLLKRHAVQRARKVGHGAEIELAGHHLVGQRRAGREVAPLDVIGRILVLAIMRQIFVEQIQLPDQEPAGRAIDGGVLRTDRNADGFRLRGSERHRQNDGRKCGVSMKRHASVLAEIGERHPPPPVPRSRTIQRTHGIAEAISCRLPTQSLTSR